MDTSGVSSDKEPALGVQGQAAKDSAVSSTSKGGAGRKRDRPSQSSDEETLRSANISRGHFPQQATTKKTKAQATGGDTGRLDKFLYRFTRGDRTQSSRSSQSL